MASLCVTSCVALSLMQSALPTPQWGHSWGAHCPCSGLPSGRSWSHPALPTRGPSHLLQTCQASDVSRAPPALQDSLQTLSWQPPKPLTLSQGPGATSAPGRLPGRLSPVPHPLHPTESQGSQSMAREATVVNDKQCPCRRGHACGVATGRVGCEAQGGPSL